MISDDRAMPGTIASRVPRLRVVRVATAGVAIGALALITGLMEYIHLSDTGQIFILICLLVHLLAGGLLLQGAFFGTKITYGGYRR